MTTQPHPENFPSYRKPSGKNAPSFKGTKHRARSAQAFTSGAQTYSDVRPGYPAEVSELVAHHDTVVDIGAGTGKLTSSLSNAFVYAIDPSADMAQELHRRCTQSGEIPRLQAVWRATAEQTALGRGSVDAITCAQTWHWVNQATASAEFDRIVKAGGEVLLVWNTLDVNADPWILRLARIMHSGDIHKEGFYPEISAPWSLKKELRTSFEHLLTPPQIHQLMHTRAYWLRNGDKIRARMTHNLNWYLYEHMGFSEDDQVALPYRTDAFLYTRS